jgi:hypothetical protein
LFVIEMIGSESHIDESGKTLLRGAGRAQLCRHLPCAMGMAGAQSGQNEAACARETKVDHSLGGPCFFGNAAGGGAFEAIP